jgi:hypothetical protein
MGKTFKIVDDDISDGYHTFDELYEHRITLFIALASHLHNRAFYTDPNDGWFVLFLELPTGQISYHLPEFYIDLVSTFASKNNNHKWDGHNSNDVLCRLLQFVKE